MHQIYLNSGLGYKKVGEHILNTFWAIATGDASVSSDIQTTARELHLDDKLINMFVKLSWGSPPIKKRALVDLFQKDLGNTEIVDNLKGLLDKNPKVVINLCKILGLNSKKVGGLLALIGDTSTLNNLSQEFLGQLTKIIGIVNPEKLKLFVRLSAGDTKAIKELNYMIGNKLNLRQIEYFSIIM